MKWVSAYGQPTEAWLHHAAKRRLIALYDGRIVQLWSWPSPTSRNRTSKPVVRLSTGKFLNVNRHNIDQILVPENATVEPTPPVPIAQGSGEQPCHLLPLPTHGDDAA